MSIGDNNHSFTESYTMSTIEIPIMASYRFVLSKTGSLHINAGPYLSYGISSKMKFTGTSDTQGNIYVRVGQDIYHDQPIGTFNENNTYDSEFDLYGKTMDLHYMANSGSSGGGLDNKKSYDFNDSPLKRMNYGLKLGVTYEIKGVQVGVNYNLMLSNMANKSYWEGTRVPVFNGQQGNNAMSGYKQRISSIEVKIGYVLRY